MTFFSYFQVSGSKVASPQLTKSEPLPSSPATNLLPTRNSTTTTAAVSTPSNGSISKPSQQTPVLQPRSQSPSTTIREQSPTPLSPKSTGVGVATLREQFDSIECSPSIPTTKIPSRPKSPVTTPASIDNHTRSSITPTKTTPVKETSPIPTIVHEPEQQQQQQQPQQPSKTIEPIPKFYFPNGLINSTSTMETLVTKQLRQAKEELFVPKQDKLYLEDFGRLAQVFRIKQSKYFKYMICYSS